MRPDQVIVSARWGGKDGKYRWLAEVVPDDQYPNVTIAQGGEELLLEDALAAAENAVHSIITHSP